MPEMCFGVKCIDPRTKAKDLVKMQTEDAKRMSSFFTRQKWTKTIITYHQLRNEVA